MSETLPTVDKPLPATLLLQVDRVCERFEAAWRAASGDTPPPCLEDYLAGADGAIWPKLLRELVLLDLEYRQRRGERPAAEEYRSRFPALPPGWLARYLGGPPAPLADRYRMGDEIGHGGMGAVFRAHDSTLGREVAVKLLLERHQGRPDVERRFLEEARIGGQLQHPGVVPVYELGRSADARPFFTMKVVEGRTLADLLDERTSPANGLPRFLTIFEQLCQAVGYAHSRGIIHRDLKPGNVMVGAFGEVQVMDWGLAKVLTGRQARPAGEIISPALTGLPLAGSTVDERGVTGVVGTPSYMPPEQARGQSAAVDERSDVFGLGAILCEILTGCPPFDGTGRAEVLRKAESGELADAFARLDSCGADAELVALARACLAARPEGRPHDGGAVAARVAAYQAGVQERLRRAELERAAAEVRVAEERKRRRVWLALAAAVLLLVVGGGGGTWWVWQRQQETDSGIAGLLGEARVLHDQARQAPIAEVRKFDDAVATARKAAKLASEGGASAAMRRQAAELVRTLEDGAEAGHRDRELLRALLEVRGPREAPKYPNDDKGLGGALAEPSADEQFAAAFREWDRAFDLDVLPTEEAAARLKGRPRAVVTEVIAALDEWAGERRRRGRAAAQVQRVADLAQALDDAPDSQRRELRALLARGNLGRERALGALALALRPVPVPFDAGLGEDRQRLRRLAAQADAAKEPALALLTLARALHVAGDDSLAEQLLRAAVWARPQEVVLHHALGQLLVGQQRWPEVVECYAAARAVRPELGLALADALVNGGREGAGLALYERLLTERPDNPWLHFDHGHALYRKGDVEGAIRALRLALDLAPKYSPAHNNLGFLFEGKGDVEGAIREYRLALDLDPKLAPAHNNLGAALYTAKKDVEGAIREYRAALDCDPKYAPAHSNLGAALRARGDVDGAIRENGLAIDCDPKLAQAHTNLGLALAATGDVEGAIRAYRRALDLDPKDATTHGALGQALLRQGRFAEARTSSRNALHLLPPDDPLRPRASRQVQQSESLLALDAKLPAVLQGDAKPADAAEAAGLAKVCLSYKRLPAAAARLYADAFAADPRLAADLQQQHRYNAACSAARAATGQGADAQLLPDKVALMWHRQAARWLRNDLEAYAKLAERDDPKLGEMVRRRLGHWQQDADLASVRGKEALYKLPADERKDWRQLWDEVAALLKKVQDTK
jgi:serine/threonine-protein kinase